MGVLGIVWKVLTLVILALIFLVAYLYFSDHTVEGEIVATDPDANPPWADAKLGLLGYTHRAQLDDAAADFVCVGYKVYYGVRSETLRVEDKTGATIYDSSKGGLQDVAGLLRCRASGILN